LVLLEVEEGETLSEHLYGRNQSQINDSQVFVHSNGMGTFIFIQPFLLEAVILLFFFRYGGCRSGSGHGDLRHYGM